MDSEVSNVERAADLLRMLRDEIGKAVVGQADTVEQVLATLLASGHVLVEGVPGLGKTLIVRAIAQSLRLTYARVQFTPDLMPSDITGHAVLDTASRELRVIKGPVFTNVLLADEINRAPAKTQSALLEVMQEYQATLEGRAHALPRPFIVLATQNPLETEGTYPLPEAQLDRFLMKVRMHYPPIAEEIAIVQRTTDKQSGDQLPLADVRPCLDERTVLMLQQLVARQRIDDKVVEYAVNIVRATRDWPGVAIGAGPRGAIALVRAARAMALLGGRDFVTPDDVKRLALPVLRHRIGLAPDTIMEGRDENDVLLSLVDSIAAPRV